MDSDNGVLPADERRRIVEQMIVEWQRQTFAAQVNLRVARQLDDTQMEKQAVAQMRRAEGAQVELQQVLAELGVRDSE